MQVCRMIQRIYYKLLDPIKLGLFKYRWRCSNRHNRTSVGTIFPIDKVSVGKQSYGLLNILSFGNPQEKLEIGHFCSIAQDVHFLLGGGHKMGTISTFPFEKLIFGVPYEASTKGPICVKDDVWIGYGSIILSGVTIGQGAVIGAGSVVVKDVPPYAVFAGGRIIKYRFSAPVIEKLVKVDFAKLPTDPKSLSYIRSVLSTNITNKNVDSILSSLNL